RQFAGIDLRKVILAHEHEESAGQRDDTTHHGERRDAMADDDMQKAEIAGVEVVEPALEASMEAREEALLALRMLLVPGSVLVFGVAMSFAFAFGSVIATL